MLYHCKIHGTSIFEKYTINMGTKTCETYDATECIWENTAAKKKLETITFNQFFSDSIKVNAINLLNRSNRKREVKILPIKHYNRWPKTMPLQALCVVPQTLGNRNLWISAKSDYDALDRYQNHFVSAKISQEAQFWSYL